MTETLLELDAIAPSRPTVAIRSAKFPDGKLYELATADDLSIEDQTELGSRGERLQKLIAKVAPGEVPPLETARELTLLLDHMVPLILRGLEPEVFASLRDMQKIRIVEVFTAASPHPATEATNPPSAPTGDAPSPAFSGSTAAIPTAG